ncbi:MAG TPA: hypothetical protein VLK36_03480 [Gaiellaceae bacterium]|nr:hypothetical protein [Gaiellaceae bacterium]
MLDRQGSRFVLEVLFLAALATGLALAKLRPLEIIGVMALGWAVVAIIEWVAWRGEPHFGSGLPPRYYVPRTSLPPAQPLEQVYAGYPDPQREEAPTWIASAAVRERLMTDWPLAAPVGGELPEQADGDDTDAEPVRLPPAATTPVTDAPPQAPVAPLPPLPAAIGAGYGVASHQLEPFAPPPGRRLLRRTTVEVFAVEVPARATPLVLPGRVGRE